MTGAHLHMPKLTARKGTAKASSNSSGKRVPQSLATAAAAGGSDPARSAAAAAAALARKKSKLEKQEAALQAKVSQ